MRIYATTAHHQHHCLELDDGRLIQSWESPDRGDIVDAELLARGFTDVRQPGALDRLFVENVHVPAYLAFLETAHERWVAEGRVGSCAMSNAWPARRMRDIRPEGLQAQLGYYSFAADCSITADTWMAAADAARSADAAAQHVAAGARCAFARCRPPGHHASGDQFGGYCYLNNAAIAAERLRQSGARRVAVLDVDYHHGNGTQDIFYHRDDVSFCSIHADPKVEFPYFLGHADEEGMDGGIGANLNVPLPHGTQSGDWFTALETLLQWIERRAAEAIVVSLGVDTFVDDPISQFQLVSEDFIRLGQRLARVDRPMVFVMEGGYATEALGTNMVNVLEGFLS
ncbi:MAG: histone deacetylase family protein [Acidimicrobiales bacterium]|nr:histone deacetylase family protein [Acidimicrobiales bacterium]MDG2219315.1 histone deacetylase family protein [Acidimicrobiales bacterium]